MGPDEARLQDVQSWLSKAELDLRAATYEVSAAARALLVLRIRVYEVAFAG